MTGPYNLLVCSGCCGYGVVGGHRTLWCKELVTDGRLLDRLVDLMTRAWNSEQYKNDWYVKVRKKAVLTQRGEEGVPCPWAAPLIITELTSRAAPWFHSMAALPQPSGVRARPEIPPLPAQVRPYRNQALLPLRPAHLPQGLRTPLP
jgi:hypothetical protein